MRIAVRSLLLVVPAAAIIAASAPAAQASFGVEKFVAVDCSEGHEACAQETFGPFSEPNEYASRYSLLKSNEVRQVLSRKTPEAMPRRRVMK